MPVYKDTNNTWFATFYYTDWMGKKHKKKKRGFKTMREAKEYERSFLSGPASNTELIFGRLCELYLEDMEGKLKATTLQTKKNYINLHILPYFKTKKITDISSADIRMWQNEIMNKGYAETSNRAINSQMSAIMNYAVMHYGLPSNPCRMAGTMGKKHADEMSFWTLDEYNKFISVINDPYYRAAFDILYWCGLRKGELMALTPKDIKNSTLTISKTASWLKGELIITEPKTQNSKRVVTIPSKINDELCTLVKALYGITENDRIFDFEANSTLNHYLNRYCEKAGVKKIRIHDLRHSHAALCINMGINMYEISKRLGHKDIKVTMNTYGHLYPVKQKNLANFLNDQVTHSFDSVF